jgi:hypothetical protein
VATTLIGVNDALAVKLWAKRLAYDIVYRTDISPLIGDDDNAVIQRKSETQKGAGDQVTFALMKKLTQDGITENQTAQGNGESLSLYSDAILINELLFNVGIPNKSRSVDAQRTLLDLRSAARRGLKTLWGERMSVTFFNHVCLRDVPAPLAGHVAAHLDLDGPVARHPEGRHAGRRSVEEPDLHGRSRHVQRCRAAHVGAASEGRQLPANTQRD